MTSKTVLHSKKFYLSLGFCYFQGIFYSPVGPEFFVTFRSSCLCLVLTCKLEPAKHTQIYQLSHLLYVGPFISGEYLAILGCLALRNIVLSLFSSYSFRFHGAFCCCCCWFGPICSFSDWRGMSGHLVLFSGTFFLLWRSCHVASFSFHPCFPAMHLPCISQSNIF